MTIKCLPHPVTFPTSFSKRLFQYRKVTTHTETTTRCPALPQAQNRLFVMRSSTCTTALKTTSPSSRNKASRNVFSSLIVPQPLVSYTGLLAVLQFLLLAYSSLLLSCS